MVTRAYSETHARRLYQKIHELSTRMYDVLLLGHKDQESLYTETSRAELNAIQDDMAEILQIRQTYLEYTIASGLYPHYINPVAYLNAIHIGVATLLATIEYGKEQFSAENLQAVMRVEIQTLIGMTSLYQTRPEITFFNALHYNLYNITEH